MFVELKDELEKLLLYIDDSKQQKAQEVLTNHMLQGNVDGAGKRGTSIQNWLYINITEWT